VKAKEPVVRTATAVLVQLWQRGFFRSWHARSAVEAQLSKAGYHFSGPELGMALMRAKHLTRQGNKGHYQYIQKYPYSPEVDDQPKKRKGGQKKS